MSGSRRNWLRQSAALAALSVTGSMPLRAQDRSADAPPVRVEREVLRTSDGVRLSLLVATPQSATPGPTLVFVPGWGMPASIWLQQLNAFGAQHRCVALDPRGQGESDAPPHGYTVERRVADLQELIAGEREVVLIGWSLGVLESLHYVHRHGDRALRALMLVDNSVGEPPAPTPSDFLKRLRADREGTVDGFVRALFAAPRPEAQIDEIKRSLLKARLDDSIALLSYPLPREHWRTVARGFAKPLAYVVTPRFEAQAQSLKKHRPDTRIEVFAGARHALFVDQATRFNEVLTQFLASALQTTST